MKLKVLGLSLLCGIAFASSHVPTHPVNGGMDMMPPPQAEDSIPPLSDSNAYLFGVTLQAIREFYVTPVTDNTIIANAARGMLENLDPHSDYLDAEDFADLKTMTNGEFSGLGVEITPASGAILVITPIDGSPAAKVGIKAGDYIVKIDGEAVEGMSVTKAMNMMRGPKGTKVKLTIVRKGETQPLNFTITRDNIVLKDVRTKVLNKHYGYIRIADFGEKTGQNVSKAVSQLFKDTHNQLYGVILDLRNNPGGVVQAATATANVFLNANEIGSGKFVVYTKGRMPESSYEGYVAGPDQLKGLPLVVLINSGTASAAEIVTGALQDYHRAVVVGVRSFGKGSVQTVFPLAGDKTAVKLTTALYYTPNGSEIQAMGITPDVVVNNYNIPDSVKPTDEQVIREGDLANHITGSGEFMISNTKTDSQANETTAEIVNGSKKAKPLIYTDYQLYQGLNLLEGLHAAVFVKQPAHSGS